MRPASAIGQRIRRLRKARKWSQEKLAAEMQLRGHSLTRQRIGEIEHGIRRVQAEEAIDFARIFDVPITEILGVPNYVKE